MKVRKTLAIAALALVALSACGKSDGSGATSPGSSTQAVAMTSDEAKAALLAAALKTANTPFAVELTIDAGPASSAVSGSSDRAAKRMQMTMLVENKVMEFRQIGTDLYTRGMENTPPGKWLHMDMNQVPGAADALGDTMQSLALLNGVVEVTANPVGTFSGKADPRVAMEKATAVQKKSMENVVKASKGQSLPFTATIKDGLLTEYSATMPVEQAGVILQAKVTMHLSDFGKPVTVEAPAAADTLELTDLSNG